MKNLPIFLAVFLFIILLILVATVDYGTVEMCHILGRLRIPCDSPGCEGYIYRFYTECDLCEYGVNVHRLKDFDVTEQMYVDFPPYANFDPRDFMLLPLDNLKCK